jgi:hypothetical protein
MPDWLIGVSIPVAGLALALLLILARKARKGRRKKPPARKPPYDEAATLALEAFPMLLMQKLDAGEGAEIGEPFENAGYKGSETLRCGRLDDYRFTLVCLKGGRSYGIDLERMQVGEDGRETSAWRIERYYRAADEQALLISRLFRIHRRTAPPEAKAE